MAKKKKLILALLGYYEHEIYRGMLSFSIKHNWLIHRPLVWDEGDLRETLKRCDGIISLHADNRHIINLLKATELPIVDIGRDIGLGCPRVYTDNYVVGKEGAEHFIERGFQNLCFLDTGAIPHHESLRKKGFYETAEKAGRNVIRLDYENHHQFSSNFKDDLKKLPTPLAIMSTSDIVAHAIIQDCLDTGLKVPAEVAVLGVVSEKIFGETTPIPISCVDTNCFDLGYSAAATLEKVMKGEKNLPATLLIQPKGVFCRQSTDIMTIDHPQIVKALGFIRTNFCEPITVEDVVEEVSISHRQLNKLFIKYLGHTILKELTRLRINHACQLLKTTSLKINEIAKQSGFSTPYRMNIVFNREINLSPNSYRKK